MLRAIVIAVVLPFSFVEVGLAQGGVTARNFAHHPAIAEVRKVVRTVDAHIGTFSARRDSVECDGGRIQLVATLFADTRDTVRKYHVEGGSDDSAGEITYWYDAQGIVRFAFAVTNAVNGTRREDRIYYDARGREIYRTSRELAGPGYPGGFDPGSDPVRHPKAEFKSLCGAER
jgi:putative ubiquitin-RnfH superfamily antitoxin RatB of RatAB toxin-antitoxin module